MSKLNARFERRLLDAADTLAELNKLKAEVLSINLDTAIPVVRVQPTKGLQKVCGAWRRSRRSEPGNRIDLMRGNLKGCFVEWEVRS
ncbi:MAG: hypothetical protein CMI09_03255 [Oceanospirillaceae bacterium]|nr:hypothetical protein [Oceanospirillaceae bacterium]|tara:strand:- start:247 stop:507 length:261 start_codon:yes stop_codon:yes gene_type:complete